MTKKSSIWGKSRHASTDHGGAPREINCEGLQLRELQPKFLTGVQSQSLRALLAVSRPWECRAHSGNAKMRLSESRLALFAARRQAR